MLRNMRVANSLLIQRSTYESVLLGVFFVLSIATGALPADATSREGQLELADGRFLAGELTDCDQPGVLRWVMAGFDNAFDFDTQRVEGIRFSNNRTTRVPEGDASCQLANGDVLFGSLVRLDESVVELESSYGRFVLSRSAIRRLFPQRASSNFIYFGPNGLDDWVTSANSWRDEAGHPVAIDENVTLYGDLKIPQQARVELELSWKNRPDFSIAVGVGRIRVHAQRALRLESWGNEIVLVRELEDKADVALVQSIAPDQQRLHIVLYVNQDSGQAIAVTEDQKSISELSVLGSSGTGIRIDARKPGLKLERVQVSRWNGLPPVPQEADQSRIHRTDGKILNGETQSYDVATKEFMVSGPSGVVTFPADQVDTIVFGSEGIAALSGKVRVSLDTGTHLTGEVTGMQGDTLVLQHASIDFPVRLPLDHIVSIQCNPPADPSDTAAVDATPGLLELDGQVVPGKLVGVQVTGEVSQLVWQPTGSANASPLSAGTAGRIVYREPRPEPQPQDNISVVSGILRSFTRSRRAASQVGNAIHLRTGDSFACEVKGISEDGVEFSTEISPASFIRHEDLQAVVFTKGKPQIVPPRAKRQRLLTLPRAQRDTPPTHLIQSRSGDFLRTRVVAMDDEFVTTEVHLETKKIPRDHVAFITWLHEGEILESPEFKHGLVQAVQGDGARVTMLPTALVESTLSGTGPVLGSVKVDLKHVDQLLIGDLIEREATRLSFHRWKLSPAIEPRYVSQSPDSPTDTAGQESSLVGQPAPAIELDLLDGAKFSLNSHRGKIVVVDFWATWCGPCVQWMPALHEVVREFAGRDVEFVAINLEEDAITISRLLDRMNLHPTVVLDRDGVVAQAYEARSIPQTVVIDRDGKVARLFIGGGDRVVQELRKSLESLARVQK